MFIIDFGLALRNLMKIKASTRYTRFLTAGSDCESSTICYRRPLGVAILPRSVMVVRVTQGH